MKRRDFLINGILGIGTLSICSCQTSFSGKDTGRYKTNNSITYLVARPTNAPLIPVPKDMRVPFSWDFFGVSYEPVKLIFNRPDTYHPQPALFRISTAIDVREQKLIEVYLPESNRRLGILDIRYSPVFQPYELALSVAEVEAVFKEGIALKQTKGNVPLWVFQNGNKAEINNKGLLPHLLFSPAKTNPREQFLANFQSLNVVQSFGWMEGCVLDGLLDLHKRFPEGEAKKTIDNHLRLFFDSNNNLHYEGPFSRPLANKFYNIEALLPFGTIAQLYPNNPLLTAVQEYCVGKADAKGLIADQQVSTEGCYTIAYPLAALAVALKQTPLARLAIQQLMHRRDLLSNANTIYQKLDENKQLQFPNWARGVSWYLLGLVRTLTVADQNQALFNELAPEMKALKEEFNRAATWVLSFQDKSSGLWFCFLDKPATAIDTSGSAGIAAALAIGSKAGYLPSVFKAPARQALKALEEKLTPDGFLTGASQANKGGMELQVNGYRVISQYASGLMAQLLSAIT